MRDLYKSKEVIAVPIRCLGISPDSKFLATGDANGEIKVSLSK